MQNQLDGEKLSWSSCLKQGFLLSGSTEGKVGKVQSLQPWYLGLKIAFITHLLCGLGHVNSSVLQNPFW